VNRIQNIIVPFTGQMAGQHNIPEDVTERHRADDFPIVEIDDEGNIDEVIKPATSNVPPLEPYLPWYDDEEVGYISRREIREFVEELERGSGAATADTIEDRLLNS
jgi:hypothetical protein